MSYGVIRVVTTWNNAGSLADVVPQPHYAGLQYPRQIYAGDETVYDDGKPFAVLRWKVLTPSQYTTVLAAFGVTTAKSAKVTLRLPGDDRTTMANWNGVAVRPEHGSDSPWDIPLYRNVQIAVRKLVGI